MREYKIRTRNGFFDFDNLEDSHVEVADIANALSRNNRFTGHTNKPYTVAQHSLYVSAMMGWDGLSPRLQLLGLMHDFHEAYFSDMSSPLKWHLKDKWGFDANEYCEAIDKIIFKKLGIREPSNEEHKIIKEYDYRAYEHERFYVFDLGNEKFKPENNGKPSDNHKTLNDFIGLIPNGPNEQELWALSMEMAFGVLNNLSKREEIKNGA